MSLAFDRNLALARARIEVPTAEANRRLFRSAVLPRLSVNGSLVRNSSEVSFGPPDDVRTILPARELGRAGQRVPADLRRVSRSEGLPPVQDRNRLRPRGSAIPIGSSAPRHEPSVSPRSSSRGADRRREPEPRARSEAARTGDRALRGGGDHTGGRAPRRGRHQSGGAAGGRGRALEGSGGERAAYRSGPGRGSSRSSRPPATLAPYLWCLPRPSFSPRR